MAEENRKIIVSIILVIGVKRDRAKKALGNLLVQENISFAEILIVDSGNDFPPI